MRSATTSATCRRRRSIRSFCAPIYMCTSLLREHHLQPHATIPKRNLHRTNTTPRIIGPGQYPAPSIQECHERRVWLDRITVKDSFQKAVSLNKPTRASWTASTERPSFCTSRSVPASPPTTHNYKSYMCPGLRIVFISQHQIASLASHAHALLLSSSTLFISSGLCDPELLSTLANRPGPQAH
jgi:hypothetical protein